VKIYPLLALASCVTFPFLGRNIKGNGCVGSLNFQIDNTLSHITAYGIYRHSALLH